MTVVYIIESKSDAKFPPVLVVAGKPSQALRLFAESIATARSATAMETLNQLEAGAALLKADPEPPSASLTTIEEAAGGPEIEAARLTQAPSSFDQEGSL